MLVHHFLENSSHIFPDKHAVWFKDKWMNYYDINKKSNKVANYLKEIGVKRGERVALMFENSFDYIIAYYAILKTGAVTVALNTETTSDTLIYLLNDCGAKVLISQKKFSKYIIPALPKIPYLQHVIIDQNDLSKYEEIGHCTQIRLSEIYETGIESHPEVRIIDIDLASLVYTSGSTGKQKAVMLTHLNIVSNTRSIVEYLELTEQDRIMVVLPFHYIYGKSLLNTHTFCGGSVVIDNRFAFPNVILDTMEKTQVTGFSGVPSTFMILLNKSTLKKRTFSSLRYVTQAGGAMAPNIQKQVARSFSPAKLFIMYGATEASARLSYLEPERLHKKWGSIGKAIPNVDLFVADEKGNPLPPNQEGQIVARGSNMMKGYWNDERATKEVLNEGLYYTGDLGKMDEDGFIFVVGRTKDMIKVGGERVSAKEIEEALLELNEIHEVAVVGVDDPVLGEALKAFVVTLPKSALNEDAIREYIRKKLPPFKIPKYVEFMEALPKNSSGKIMKTELRQHKN